MRIAVTGAYGFSGKYIARRLLDLRHEVITLTNSPHRANPFGESIKAFPYNFSRPHLLEKSLSGFDVLINTYWVRFDKPPHFTFAQALANAKVLFDAARRAGIRRLVHISITNPDRSSDLPYFSGKAPWWRHSPMLVEAFPAAQLRHWGLPYEGYSGSTQEVRRDIVNAFARRRLSVPTPHRYQMLESPDALDAVLAAFAAVAVCRNRIAVPPPDNTEEEGWIAVHE
jgi:hypothetical protein